MGRHNKASVMTPPLGNRRPLRGMVWYVDARTRLIHLLTDDAIATARHAEHPYLALCGQEILPA